MRIINGFRLSATLGSIFFAVTFGGSASAAGSGNIAAFCEFHLGLAEIHRSSVFQADDDDRDDWAWEWREHLLAIGVKKEELGRPFCRAWRGADAVESANAAAEVSDYRPIIRINWVPRDSLRSSASTESSRPPQPRIQHAPQESASPPSKYIEVAGPDGKTIRLSPEVAARNKAAAEEYRRKMETHERAKADHDRKLVQHQENAAEAAAAKQAHELRLAANAAEVAAHNAAMDDYRKKLTGASTNDDPNRCITSPAIKPGLRGNTEVHVTNGCDQKVDIVICLKRTTGDWLCGARFGILSQRSMSFMSTNATGEIYVDAVTFGSKNKLGRPAGIIK